jgi:hypothetical protein
VESVDAARRMNPREASGRCELVGQSRNQKSKEAVPKFRLKGTRLLQRQKDMKEKSHRLEGQAVATVSHMVSSPSRYHV